MRRFLLYALAAVLLAGLALGVYAFWIEPRSLVVTRVEIASPHWPEGAPELRIVVIADIQPTGPHLTPPRIARIIARANAERPDLVLLPGDYVSTMRLRTSFVPPEAVAAALAELEAPLGVIGVLGNHDWMLDGPRVRRALEQAGVVVLEDEVRRIEADGVTFWVAGLNDLLTQETDLPGTLAKVTDDDAPVILLTHSPDIFPEVPERVALTVAGHTHGGQVNLPFIGRPIVTSAYGQRYAYGHIVEDGRQMFVSSGIGFAILPVRFRVPPEIVVLTLRRADG